MTPAIDIVSAAREELAEILKIENSSFSSPWSAQLFIADLEGDHSGIYVAREKGSETICGYLCYSLVVDELHILNLAVDAAFRQQKIGSALVAHCLSEAIKADAMVAFLEVRESHKIAKALYEKSGFKPLARRKKYYSDNGEDAIVMIKKLC